ncbi:MAG: UbiH/UbiF/VisC/COQ6 family ubiquinone biosynthesis hydroxylase [Sinobacteraceae bacterium]|nr:UbiH/UbiF/VisC/COQ6 family ubiquinone biosynthesis hydroxylase [Nevskiaceae bacterium]
MNNRDVQVAIIGAGPVGCVLALALARAGVSTALIEARQPPAWNEAETDLRVFALSRASQNILTRLDLWSSIAAARASAYGAMEVWEANGQGRVRFAAADVGEPDLGHIVEGNLLAATLAERVRNTHDIVWHCPEKLERLNVHDEGVELLLSSGKRINAQIAVGADGARSPTRQLAGIEVDEKPYKQTAVVAHLRPEKSHGGAARQIFRPNGPLALLPLSDGRVSIVWSTSPEEAEQLLNLDEAAFGNAVAKASEHALGHLTLESKRASFPLHRLHAKSYVAPRVVLVGDAAHVVHPLAGQGMNLGLLDAAALAEVITDAKRAGRDVDDYLVLRRYERWRHGENLAAQTALTGFKQLFGLDSDSVRNLRGAGMKLFDLAGPVKRQTIRIALGTAGDLPALAKPLV